MRISDWSSDVCSSDLVNAISISFKKSQETHPLYKREQVCGKPIIGAGHTGGWPGADVQSLEPRRERPATRNPVHAKRRRPRCPGRIQHEAARQWTSLAHFSPTLRRHCARSEEHTSELQSIMRNSYAVFC